MIAPICIQPKKDEFLYGWLLRLAAANGFSCYPDNVHTFTHFYFYKHEPVAKTNGTAPLDRMFNLDNICDEYSQIQCFPNLETIIHNMTIFPAIQPFLSEKEQTKRFMVMLREKQESVLDFSYMKSTVSKLHVCPQCMKRDVAKYGEAYYHVWHQFPAVRVCPVHKCCLMTIKTPGKGFLNGKELPEMEEEKLTGSFEFELRIAQLMYELYKKPQGGSLENTIVAAKKVMVDRGYKSKLKYADIVSDMKREGTLFRPDMEKWIDLFLQGKTVLENVIYFCVFLFKNSETLKKYCNHEKIRKDIWRTTSFKKDYTLVSTSRHFLTLQCKTCGSVFHTISYALSRGFGCPECEKELSDEQILEKHIKCVGDGNYVLDGEIQGKNFIKIRHTTCGKSKKELPREIMYGIKPCKCEQRLTEKKIQECVDGGLKRFVLVSYEENGKNCKVVIRDKICGESFSADLKTFQRNRHCRVCESRGAFFSNDQFQEEMELLTGDEYILEQGDVTSREKCSFRHMKCEAVIKMSPASFINGERCPVCFKKITFNHLQEAIYECTEDRYKVIGSAIGKVGVQCSVWEEVWKPASYLFAELERPSESDIFQYRVKKPVREEHPMLKVYESIRDAAKNGKTWIMGEHKDDLGMEGRNIDYRLKQLLALGVIKKMGSGKYVPMSFLINIE